MRLQAQQTDDEVRLRTDGVTFRRAGLDQHVNLGQNSCCGRRAGWRGRKAEAGRQVGHREVRPGGWAVQHFHLKGGGRRDQQVQGPAGMCKADGCGNRMQSQLCAKGPSARRNPKHCSGSLLVQRKSSHDI